MSPLEKSRQTHPRLPGIAPDTDTFLDIEKRTAEKIRSLHDTAEAAKSTDVILTDRKEKEESTKAKQRMRAEQKKEQGEAVDDTESKVAPLPRIEDILAKYYDGFMAPPTAENDQETDGKIAQSTTFENVLEPDEKIVGIHKIMNVVEIQREINSLNKETAVCQEIASKLRATEKTPSPYYQMIMHVLQTLDKRGEELFQHAMTTSPDYFNFYHLSELATYHKAIEKGRLIETESVKVTMDALKEAYATNQAVFLSGPFGAGKTEKAIQASADFAIQSGTVTARVRAEMGFAPDKGLTPQEQSKLDARVKVAVQPLIVGGRKEIDFSEISGHQTLIVDPKTQAEFDKWNAEVDKGVAAFQEKTPNATKPQIESQRTRLWQYFSQSAGTQTQFFLGPIYQAMKEGRGFILDEVNAIPHTVLIGLNHILTRKPGDVVTVQQDSGELITVQPGYTFTATGNVPDERGNAGYQGRQTLDAAFLNRFIIIKDKYLPQSTSVSRESAIANGEPMELYEVMVAALMDAHHDIVAPTDTLDELWQLAIFIARVQRIYSGEATDEEQMSTTINGTQIPLTDALKNYTISWRGVNSIMKSWKKSGFTAPLKNITKQYISQSSLSHVISTQLPDQLDNYKMRDGDSPVSRVTRMLGTEVVAQVYGEPPARELAFSVPSILEKQVHLTAEQMEKINKMSKHVSKVALELQPGGDVYTELAKACETEFPSNLN